MEIHICSITEYDNETRVPTIVSPDSSTFYLVPTEDGTSPDLFTEWVYVNGAWEMFGSAKIDLSGYLTDVKVNGTSVVDSGMANIPIASDSQLGVVKYNSLYGIKIASNGILRIAAAGSPVIKMGVGNSTPITPELQHESTFYGLAKAAGYDEKDSTLPVGQYTDNAKDSIQNMLGITPLIASHESDPFESAHEIGELFIINGKLYRAKTALTAGEYINEGTNVEVVDIAEVLDDYATKEDVQDNVSIVEKSTSGSIASFPDGADNLPLKSLIVNIDPVQDLHGYDSPWVAGGGKNLFQTTMQTTSISGVTATVNNDGSIKITGTPTSLIGSLVFGKLTLPAGTYKANGFTLGSRTATRLVIAKSDVSVIYATIYGGSDVEFTLTEETELRVYPIIGTSDYQDGETFYPMIRKATETDATFVPYENICPISGWEGMNLSATGKNLLDPTLLKDQAAWNTIRFYAPVGTTITASTNCTDTTTATGLLFYLRRSNEGQGSSNYVSASHHVVRTVGDDGYLIINQRNPSGTKSFDDFQWQVEIGTDDTPYEPYNGRTIPISWQTEAGTVYGGKLDVLRGKLMCDRIFETYGIDDNFTEHTLNNQRIFQCKRKKSPVNRDFISNMITRVTSIGTATADNTGYFGSTYFNIKMTSKTLAEFNAMITETPIQTCSKIDTPIEIQLTPHEVSSLLGQNNIFADTGDTSVEYFSYVDIDLTDYVDANLKPYAKKSDLPTIPVNDVQINSTSILSNGVANIPYGSNDNYGLLKASSTNGIFASGGVLSINNASESDIKGGTEELKPLTPNREHMAVFYGLTKAAGVDMSSSTNEIGTYTDEAKTAIKQMLGVHDTYDSFVEEITGTDVTITGQPSYRYNCGEVLSLSITPPESGTIDIRFTSGSTPTILTLPSTVKMPEWWVEVEANTIYEMCITDGIYCGVMSWAM